MEQNIHAISLIICLQVGIMVKTGQMTGTAHVQL